MAATSGATRITNDWRATATKEDTILEAWGQGFVVGALLIMLCITVANMKHKVLLWVLSMQASQQTMRSMLKVHRSHKLILIEVSSRRSIESSTRTH